MAPRWIDRIAVPALAFFAVVAIAWILGASMPQQRISVDDAATPMLTPQPAARNVCEQLFARQLISNLSPDAVQSPTEEQVRSVLDACTANELLAADERFTFITGWPMGYLTSRRLFNGPGVPDQFATLCTKPAFATSKACQARIP